MRAPRILSPWLSLPPPPPSLSLFISRASPGLSPSPSVSLGIRRRNLSLFIAAALRADSCRDEPLGRRGAPGGGEGAQLRGDLLSTRQ